MSSAVVEAIEAHIGGADLLDPMAVRDIAVNHDHVSFRLAKASPNKDRTVVITARPDALLRIYCYGERSLGSLSAPLAESAERVVPESPATVFGSLTGVEDLRHRHF